MVTDSRDPSATGPAGRLTSGSEEQGASASHTFVGAGSACAVGSARRLNEPRAALVEAQVDGTPRQVNRKEVALVREEWRVVDRWWTEEPISRRYFELVLETGENVIVFRDGERGAWFTQRA